MGNGGAPRGAPTQRGKKGKGKRGKNKPKRADDYDLGNSKHRARLGRIARAKGVVNPPIMALWRDADGKIRIWDKSRGATIVLVE